jgi:hypothetical protein
VSKRTWYKPRGGWHGRGATFTHAKCKCGATVETMVGAPGTPMCDACFAPVLARIEAAARKHFGDQPPSADRR